MGVYIWTGSTRHWSPNGNTIGYWELNGNGNDTKNDYGVQTYTATDYDSTGYSGAGNPSYVSLSGGKQCAYFDGTRVLNLPYLPIPSNTITISMWVKFPSSSRGSFFSLREDLSGGPGWAVRAGVAGVGGALWYSYVTSSPTEYDFNNVTTTENERHNIIFTFNGGTGKYYVDGDLKQTMSGGTSLRDTNQSSSHIGGEVNYNSSHYGLCYLSDIIYENTTRTEDQAADYYNDTKSNYGIS